MSNIEKKKCKNAGKSVDHDACKIMADKETPSSVNAVSPIYGTVYMCKRLNIRTDPDKASEIICTVSSGEKLIIRASDSTDEWLNVCTGDGFHGYCMRKYVSMTV